MVEYLEQRLEMGFEMQTCLSHSVTGEQCYAFKALLFQFCVRDKNVTELSVLLVN